MMPGRVENTSTYLCNVIYSVSQRKFVSEPEMEQVRNEKIQEKKEKCLLSAFTTYKSARLDNCFLMSWPKSTSNHWKQSWTAGRKEIRLLSFKTGMLCADDALAKPNGSVNTQHVPCSLFAVLLSAFKLGDGETQPLKTDPHLRRCPGRQRSGLHRGAAAARGSAEPSSSGWSGCFRSPFRIKTLLLPPFSPPSRYINLNFSIIEALKYSERGYKMCLLTNLEVATRRNAVNLSSAHD
ncbi:uncharacterized protein LOC118247802 [Cygnus atratus]|uniref:uncharacterized protein LOC118247802 n=1 Tax=Cygnus atratus TaxID=8868 RepID=UPI0021B8249F|nr:uncharacterized protein LOC118247802 [Cygnus atratus]